MDLPNSIAWSANWTLPNPLYEEFLALAQEIGDRGLVAIGELNLAMVAIS